jgi:DNA-binding CsgD family transcriptional regulator
MMKPLDLKHRKPLTKREQADILRLYLEQRLPAPDTARRLGLDHFQVRQFLRHRGILRGRGNPGVPTKLSVTGREKLISELKTVTDVVLARKYGVSRERVRQIRQQMGYLSSRVIRRGQMARARAQREKQERRAVELRHQQRWAKRLVAINKLSKRWKSGAPISELAREFGLQRTSMQTHIGRMRKKFPGKFPLRYRMHSRR